MKTILLKGELRNATGSSSAKAIRAKGMVPCVMYGAGENVNFSVYEADFKNLVYTPNAFKVKLDISGNTYDAILQDMQFDAVSEAILHADFYAVVEGKAVVMEVPIRVVGNSPGVRAGGKLVKKFNKLRVRGLLSNLPDYIDVSIDTLEIGQSMKVKNLEPKGFEILDAKENAIVSVKTTRALMQAGAEAAAAGKK